MSMPFTRGLFLIAFPVSVVLWSAIVVLLVFVLR
jgi:hypothetical protein